MDNQVKAYDSEADLAFDTKVFRPITLDNVTVYNTRRIAFDHYQDGGVKIFEPIQLPSIGDEMCNNQRVAILSACKWILVHFSFLSHKFFLFPRSAKTLQG